MAPSLKLGVFLLLFLHISVIIILDLTDLTNKFLKIICCGGHTNMGKSELLHERFEFRDIRPEEADRAAEIEQLVFPPHEAVAPEDVKKQIKLAPEVFLVAVDKENGEIAGFLNGIATNEKDFRDEFFTDKSLHNPDGDTVMLLGLDVVPDYRMQGLGRELVDTYCRREQARGRKRLVLTCLPRLVEMYAKMGFEDLGISGSSWGDETWHEMEKTL